MTTKQNTSQVLELDLFSVLNEYPKEIVNNQSDESHYDDLDMSKNVLICNVKKDNMEHFLDGTAKIYYTGKRFPDSIALNPYIGKQCDLDYHGIRDLYVIKIARVGSRREGELDNDPNDLRLVFELQFVKHLYDQYKPIRLNIWATFTDTTLQQLADGQKKTPKAPERLTYVCLFSSADVGCYGFKSAA